jgi:multidrug resistance protein, MATE family
LSVIRAGQKTEKVLVMSDIVDFEYETRTITAHGLEAWKEEVWELAKLSGPVILTQIAFMAIMTTDVVMLSHLSLRAVASAALGNIVFFSTWLLGYGPVCAIAPIVAHILGADPKAELDVRAAVRMGLWSVLMIAPFQMAFLFAAKPLLLLLGQNPVLATGAGTFTSALAFGLPFSLGYQALRNFATALKRPMASMIVMLITIAFNAMGDYTLIFGHFGAPRLGILGAGIASASSLAFSFFAMLTVIYATPLLRQYRIFKDFFQPHWKHLREIFHLGMPIALTMMAEGMFFNASVLLMGTFGVAAVAAHQISLNVPSITFMVPLGIATAATVRVGHAAGAGDSVGVRRAGYSAMMLAVMFMSVCSIVLFVFPHTIAGLYFDASLPQNAEAIMFITVFLRVAAAFQIFDGLQVVAALALRGVKDARMPMILAGGSYWLAGFPACLFFGFVLGLKGFGIWLGLAFGLFVAAVAMCWRFYYLTRPR